MHSVIGMSDNGGMMRQVSSKFALSLIAYSSIEKSYN